MIKKAERTLTYMILLMQDKAYTRKELSKLFSEDDDTKDKKDDEDEEGTPSSTVLDDKKYIEQATSTICLENYSLPIYKLDHDTKNYTYHLSKTTQYRDLRKEVKYEHKPRVLLEYQMLLEGYPISYKIIHSIFGVCKRTYERDINNIKSAISNARALGKTPGELIEDKVKNEYTFKEYK